jgi:hypothetical protein
LGVLLAGCFALNCSSPSDEAYDAGTLPDAYFPAEDAGGPDTASNPVGADASDATLPLGPDGSVTSPDDAGDSFPPLTHDSGLDAGSDAWAGADAGDGSARYASDASPSNDASDASQGADANDASQGADANDASRGSDAADAADSSDTGPGIPLLDASGDGASDGASSFDAALCATFNPSSDPIEGVAAFDGTQLIEEDSTSGSTVGTGTASFGDTVSITAWTAPLGILQSAYVDYTTDGFTTHTVVSLASGGATNAGPVTGTAESWSGAIPAQPHGTTVVWYVYAADACTGALHYFSNNGQNYEYTTP